MIKIARLTIKYAHSENEGPDMKTVLQSHMDKCGVTMNDITYEGKDRQSSTHFGNWVLTPCLDNEALRKLANSMKTEIDYHDAILEQSDIDGFMVNDKVKVKFIGDFAQRVDSEGKVLRKTETDITILQKGKRKYGWKFNTGDRVFIEKIKQ